MFRSVQRFANVTRLVRPQYAMRTFWTSVEMGPPDAILGITVAYRKDPNPNKINLGVGAYRDDDGKPYILGSVREAEKRIHDANLDHEYLPIDGLAEFKQAALKLAYGGIEPDTPVPPLIEKDAIASTQTLSGTGALRLCGEWIYRFMPQRKLYLPTPTWGNHKAVFAHSHIETVDYRYYDPETKGLDFKGLIEDLQKLPKHQVVLLHGCAHNPTGVDPSEEQWKEISAVVKEREHLPLIDLAYQGFASGDPERDAFSLRQFVEDGHHVVLCQSFAKNMGMYGQRVGAFSLVCNDADEKDRVESQLKILVRPLYSNPPSHGARLVSTVLNDADLRSQWRQEVKGMADRIIGVRHQLRDELARLGSVHDWSHITDQIGMFCYSGLSGEQVDQLARDWSVYLTRDGRISVAGITSKNVNRLAEAIHAVTK